MSMRSSDTFVRTISIFATASWLLVIAGCGMNALVTRDSGTGQKLVYGSLERAVSHIDVSKYAEGKIAVNLFTQTDSGTRLFVEKYLIDRLKEKGLNIVQEEAEADRVMDVFVPVLGLNHGETLIGLPSIPSPIFGVSTPEVAFYKASRNLGKTEILVYTFDARSGEFISKSKVHSGSTYYNNHKVLLFINFTRTDLK